jgi:S1-C subfamily serine protease
MKVPLRPCLVACLLLLLGCLTFAHAEFADAAAKVGDAVVTVASDKGTGAGVIVNSDGHIVTNTHVVGEAEQVLVKLRNDEELTARVLRCNVERDLCLLKVERQYLPAAELASSAKLKQGQTVGAVGAPLGLSNSLTKGIISSLDREIQGQKYIQVDAALNRGNSGGPIINETGQVVGIATKVAREAENLGFAIPSDDVMTFLSEANITFQAALGDAPATAAAPPEAGPATEGEAPLPEQQAPDTPGFLANPAVTLALAALIAVLVSLVTTVLVAGRMLRTNVVHAPPPAGVAYPPQAAQTVYAPPPPVPPAAPQPQQPVEDLSDIDIELR